jgi:hypothetical protein
MAFEAVVLADNDVAPTWRLEFQRPLEIDDQDVALGMDSYCLVFPNGASAYGCLSSISMENQI